MIALSRDFRERITLIGDIYEELPTASILHYAKVFTDNYQKLSILEQIMDAMERAPESTFYLEQESHPLLPGQLMKGQDSGQQDLRQQKIADFIPQTDFEDPLKLNRDTYDLDSGNRSEKKLASRKEEDPTAVFFGSLRRHARPVVYQHDQGVTWLAYDYTGTRAIKLTKLAYNSPPSFEFLGVVSVLRDLVGLAYDADENQRAKEKHEWERAEHEQKMALMKSEQALCDEKIQQYKRMGANSLALTDAAKCEAERMKQSILQRQRAINTEYNIRLEENSRFDKKV